MKRSIFTQMITWLCILSFGMHVVLHLGPAFPWGTGHSGHGDDRHSLVNYGVSNNSIQSRSEFDAGLNITEYLVSSNHSHHTPADHNPEPEDHDPTHHLTIQYRATCQISYDPFDAHLQHKFLRTRDILSVGVHWL